MHPQFTDIGSYVKSLLGLAPAAVPAGTRNGAGVDASLYKSGVLVALQGATTGAPTGISVTYRLESRQGPAGAWGVVTNRDGANVEVVATAASGVVELDFDLSLLASGHDEIRATEITAFTGGTAPTILSAVALVLGGSSRLPV